MRQVVVLVAGLLLVGCAAAGTPLAPGEKQQVSKEVWEDYQAYKEKIHGNGQGAYAITVDGRAGGYSWCPDGADRCVTGKTVEGIAMDGCRQSGLDCRLFDDHGTIVVPYEVEK
jgi:hypothetical protein